MNANKSAIPKKNVELLTMYSKANTKAEKLQLENDLIELNDKFIYFICNKFKTPKLSLDDKYAVCMFGMLKAIRSFDLSKGIKFITYAARIMNNEILMELRKGKKHLNVASLDDTMFFDKDGGELTLEDMLPDNKVDIERDFLISSEVAEIKEVASNILNKTEQIIFNEMIANEEPLTQREVSQKLKISQSYVSRIKQKVKQKLIKETKKKEEEKIVVNITKATYKKMKNKGLKDKEIAEEVGISLTTLYSFKYQNGLTKKHKKKRNNSWNKEKLKVELIDNPAEKEVKEKLNVNIPKEEIRIHFELEETNVADREEKELVKKDTEKVEELANEQDVMVEEETEGIKELKEELELAHLKIKQFEASECDMKNELASLKKKLHLTEKINNLLMEQHLTSIA